MLLSAALLACVAWQEAPAPPPAAPWQRVATFGRLLAQKLTGQVVAARMPDGSPDRVDPFTRALRGAMGGAPAPASGAGMVGADGGAGGGMAGLGGGGDPNVESAFGDTLRALMAEQAQGLVVQTTEHIPSLGSVVSLSLALPVEAAPSELGAPAAASGATPSNDDAEWDAAANGGRASGDLFREYRGAAFAMSGAGGNLTPVRYEFAAGSLEAMRGTVVETIARFGSRLELARNERLAVVVKVEAQSNTAQRLWSHSYGACVGAPGGSIGSGGTAPLASSGASGVPVLSELPLVSGLFRTAAQLPEPKRFVFQIGGAELADLRGGRLSRTAFTSKLEVAEY